MKNSNSFNSLIEDLSKKYGLHNFEIRNLINETLIELYNVNNLSLDEENKSFLAIVDDKEFKFKTKYFNVSNKHFTKLISKLETKLLENSLERINLELNHLVKISNNVLYGRVEGMDGNSIVFNLYNKNNKKIYNFIAKVKVYDMYKNELKNIEKGDGILLYIPKRAKPINKNGLFHIKAIRKHPVVLRHLINNSFKDIRKKLNSNHAYSRCMIKDKEKEILIFSKVSFSEPVREYIQEEINRLDNYKIIFIKDNDG